MPIIKVIIPAYNEEKYIEGVIKNSSKFGMDMIIIDDGSIDSTSSIVKSLIPVYSPLLKLIRHKRNLGKGQSLITGFDYIKENNYLISNKFFHYEMVLEKFNFLKFLNLIIFHLLFVSRTNRCIRNYKHIFIK